MKGFRVFATLLITFVVTEIALRLIWGFGTPVLYRASTDYEYIYAPDQDVRRYGNHILTNSYGMRSPEPESGDSIRILYIGDSVINGGMHTSQDELSSSILAARLTAIYHKPVNVLNISAGSWGPDNGAAFLKKHGTFGAKAMVLVFSSHDAFDTMDFEPIVDQNVNYPGKKPLFAISEVFLRYLTPYIGSIFGVSEYSKDKLMINNQRKKFNPGWQELLSIAREDSIPVIAVLHAEQKEMLKGQYNRYGRRIQDTLSVKNIPVYTDISWGIAPEHYRDFIHLNSHGQQFLADHLEKPLQEMLDAQIVRIRSSN